MTSPVKARRRIASQKVRADNDAAELSSQLRRLHALIAQLDESGPVGSPSSEPRAAAPCSPELLSALSRLCLHDPTRAGPSLDLGDREDADLLRDATVWLSNEAVGLPERADDAALCERSLIDYPFEELVDRLPNQMEAAAFLPHLQRPTPAMRQLSYLFGPARLAVVRARLTRGVEPGATAADLAELHALTAFVLLDARRWNAIPLGPDRGLARLRRALRSAWSALRLADYLEQPDYSCLRALACLHCIDGYLIPSADRIERAFQECARTLALMSNLNLTGDEGERSEDPVEQYERRAIVTSLYSGFVSISVRVDRFDQITLAPCDTALRTPCAEMIDDDDLPPAARRYPMHTEQALWRRRYSVVICIFELSLCIARSQYDLDIITELENRLEALGKTLSPHGVFYVNGKGDIGCTPAAVGSSQMARQLDQQMRCSYYQGRLLLDRLILSAPHAALPIALVERHASELVSNARIYLRCIEAFAYDPALVSDTADAFAGYLTVALSVAGAAPGSERYRNEVIAFVYRLETLSASTADIDPLPRPVRRLLALLKLILYRARLAAGERDQVVTKRARAPLYSSLLSPVSRPDSSSSGCLTSSDSDNDHKPAYLAELRYVPPAMLPAPERPPPPADWHGSIFTFTVPL